MPENWGVRRLKYLVSINDQVLSEATAPNYKMRYVDIGGVDHIRGIHSVEDTVFGEAPDRARRVVRHGDTIVSTVRTYLRAIASIRQPAPNTIVSTGFAVLRPKLSLCSDFAYYALNAPGFIDDVVARSVGANYPAINARDIGDIPIAVPLLLDDQRTVATYLERETAKIDALIARNEALIKHLKEQRAALISRTVTRGLPPAEAQKAGINPHPKLKLSGVEWLGKVPEHWDVAPVKRYYDVRLGKMLQTEANTSSDQKVAYLKAKHVQWFSIRSTDLPKMWASPHDMKCFSIRYGDLLVCEGGEGGRSAIVPKIVGRHIIQNALHRVRPRDSASNPWLQYVLSTTASVGLLDAINSKATIAHFTSDKLNALPIPVPPQAEVKVLVAYLNHEMAKIDKAAEFARQESGFLREYRTRLISDVVTGKVVVRGIAAADMETAT